MGDLMKSREVVIIVCFLIIVIDVTKICIESLIILKRIAHYEGPITAKVVDIIDEHCYRRLFTKIYYYYPVYQYTVDGKRYEKKSIRGARYNRYPVGAEVPLYFNKSNPENSIVGEKAGWKRSARNHLILAIIFWGVFIYYVIAGRPL